MSRLPARSVAGRVPLARSDPFGNPLEGQASQPSAGGFEAPTPTSPAGACPRWAIKSPRKLRDFGRVDPTLANSAPLTCQVNRLSAAHPLVSPAGSGAGTQRPLWAPFLGTSLSAGWPLALNETLILLGFCRSPWGRGETVHSMDLRGKFAYESTEASKTWPLRSVRGAAGGRVPVLRGAAVPVADCGRGGVRARLPEQPHGHHRGLRRPGADSGPERPGAGREQDGVQRGVQRPVHGL